jgi:hypothetical protein
MSTAFAGAAEEHDARLDAGQVCALALEVEPELAPVAFEHLRAFVVRGRVALAGAMVPRFAVSPPVPAHRNEGEY